VVAYIVKQKNGVTHFPITRDENTATGPLALCFYRAASNRQCSPNLYVVCRWNERAV